MTGSGRGADAGLDPGYLRLRERARDTLTDWAAPDPQQRGLRDGYLTQLREHRWACAKAGPPAHLTTGTVVLDATGEHTLLVLHGKARRWFQPGGHLEPGDADLGAAAAREAAEETGLLDLVLDPEPVHLDRHRLPGQFGTCREHLDVRFLAIAPHPHRARPSPESLDLRWWPVQDLPEPDVAPLVAAGIHRLRARNGSPRGEDVSKVRS